MKRSVKGLSILVATIVVLLLTSTIASAAAYQLSGWVTDQAGAAISGVVVELIDPATGESIASATTDSNGSYALPVAEGTYNVLVNPPSSSGFGPSVALNQIISADKNLDFVLVPAGIITLSGKVLDPLGNNVPGQYITLTPWGGGPSTATRTDSSGDYLLAVAPGDYQFTLSGSSSDSSPSIPTYYSILTGSGYAGWGHMPLSLNQSTVLDFQLPGKKVDLHVQDPAGNPVPNVRIQTNDPYILNFSWNGLTVYSRSYADDVTTNASGDVSFWLFPNSYSFTAFPPEGNNLVTTTLSGINIVEDTSVTLVIQEAITLSGKVLDPLGNNVPGQYITLTPWGGGPSTATRTDSSGDYLLAVAPGDYQFTLSGSSSDSSPSIPTYYSILTGSGYAGWGHMPLSLNQSTVLDFQLPGKKVDLHVQDPAGNPVPNVRIQTNDPYILNFSWNGLTVYSRSYADDVTTNASGDVSFWLFPNSYSFTAFPPEGNNLVTTTLSGINIAEDTSVTLVIQEAITLSGKVLDPLGNNVPGQYITLTPWGGGPSIQRNQIVPEATFCLLHQETISSHYLAVPTILLPIFRLIIPSLPVQVTRAGAICLYLSIKARFSTSNCLERRWTCMSRIRLVTRFLMFGFKQTILIS